MAGEGRLPRLDLDAERCRIYAVIKAVELGLVLACHDVGEGGLFTTLAEMTIGGWGGGRVGAEIDVDVLPAMPLAEVLFCESGGFVIETDGDSVEAVLGVCAEAGAAARAIGETVAQDRLTVKRATGSVLEFDGGQLREAWLGRLEESIR